jgi:hypothetical protein
MYDFAAAIDGAILAGCGGRASINAFVDAGADDEDEEEEAEDEDEEGDEAAGDDGVTVIVKPEVGAVDIAAVTGLLDDAGVGATEALESVAAPDDADASIESDRGIPVVSAAVVERPRPPAADNGDK